MWNNNVKVNEHIRSYLKSFNSEKRNENFYTKSNRIKKFFEGIGHEQKKYFAMTMDRYHRFLNTNFVRESIIKFIMKTLASILPSRENLKRWKLANNDKCLWCNEIDSTPHILEQICKRKHHFKVIQNSLSRVKVTGLNNVDLKPEMISSIQKNWKVINVVGILNEELIDMFKVHNLKIEKIIEISTKQIQIGKKLWDEYLLLKNQNIDNTLDIPDV